MYVFLHKLKAFPCIKIQIDINKCAKKRENDIWTLDFGLRNEDLNKLWILDEENDDLNKLWI